MRCKKMLMFLGVFLLGIAGDFCVAGLVDEKMHHVRSGSEREWDEFPQQAEGKELLLRFNASKNEKEQTLRFRQRDAKQTWTIRLNDKKLGTLLLDEKDTTIYQSLPPGALRDGENELKISCDGGAGLASDDIEVGEISIVERPRQEVLDESRLKLIVLDASGKEIPSRITIVDERGSLISLGTLSSETLAVRAGVVYSATGRATIAFPAGKYAIYAGRGFEYSIDSAQIDLKPGETAEKTFRISRVVQTPGYVSCDTHIHTVTYSRHGDCTTEERMLTLAGENIELAIATDHNLQIDFAPVAEKLGVRKYLTPVIGNEVTTATQGHFNVFPIPAESKLLNFRAANWDVLAENISQLASPNPVIILNHARDIHNGFRPDDPSKFISITGERLDGRKLPANAMEVINSGAIMNDPMRLYRDWFGLLNRGQKLTPVGASDSHDVSRYIVGQARTYIRCDDNDPGNINVDEARKNFLAGKVLVSYGLLSEITVNEKFSPGDLVSSAGPLDIKVTVQSPPWSRPNRVALYANGIEIKSAEFPPSPGRKWETTWTLPRPKHDIYLVAIATGPGIPEPYWQTAKPYQPTSSAFTPYVLGSTGAVWIDADNNGHFDSAYEYAKKITEASDVPVSKRLADFDEAVAAQVASIMHAAAPDQFETTAQNLISTAPPAAKRGFQAYLRELQESKAAASATRPARD